MILQASSFNIAVPLSGSSTGRSRHSHVVRAQGEPSDKSVEIMRKFSEQYARKSGTYFCVDKGVTAVVIKLLILKLSNYLLVSEAIEEKKLRLCSRSVREAYIRSKQGLADHKDTLGAPLCPCRHYDDKAAEVAQGFWNCPCVPMRERKECHCMLFLTPENDFAGNDQVITMEDIKATTANM
ncbi:Ferredoxin-thioredoxin reductase catalytic chain, chloroplastic [Cucurbita argyrosperma subsp. argyrosperma]|nr:Ferredoxin-thioredoxin reductase catalytic chain, chloroplastic [Cucurbita argyrosperma subsp. argyrosperma]